MELIHLYPAEYRKWRNRLGPETVGHIRRRLDLLARHGTHLGLPNVRRLSFDLWELRSPTGHRLYFTLHDEQAIFIRYGDKDTQPRDIDVALARIRSNPHGH